MKIYHLKANGAKSLGQNGAFYKRTSRRVLSYYVVANEPLILDFCIPKNTLFDMDLLESSFDLLHNPAFKILPRENWMMPTPFVLTDAVVIRQKIKPTVVMNRKAVATYVQIGISKDSIVQNIDTLKAK
jgi:hypothetical protein